MKENHIGLAVSEVLQYKHTNTQTNPYLIMRISCIIFQFFKKLKLEVNKCRNNINFRLPQGIVITE